MVPVVDLARYGAAVADDFATIAADLAAGGSYLLGERTAQLEMSLAEYTGLPSATAACVSSGAGALQLALTALGVGAGDEVIVPSFTAVPTASAVVAAGAIPVLADVDPDTACITPGAIERVRTGRSRAVIVVHLYGYPASLPDTDLIVIEDAAQSFGSVRGPRPSAATCFSFYPTKNLGGIGDGGAVVSSDSAVIETVRRLRAHGMAEQYRHVELSQNFRMSELEAAWLLHRLPSVAAGNERRRHIAATYRATAPELHWQTDHPDHVAHLCVFRHPQRDAVRARLAELGVATAVHYPAAIHQQPAFAFLADSDCPISSAWAAQCITVPCFPEMTDEEIARVAAGLAAIEDEYR